MSVVSVRAQFDTSWRGAVVLFVAAAALPSGCKGSGGKQDGTTPPAERAAVVAALGGCALDVYRTVVPAAEDLAAATAARAAEDSPEKRAAARAAWVRTIGLWQEAELFQFGPAGPRKGPGGLGLRDEIYAWPLVSRCLVEQQIADGSYGGTDFPRALVNVRGLAALEYLLFHDGADNACGPTATINSSGAWAALGAGEIERRKRAYAAVAAAEVLRWTRALADAWDPDKGNFQREIVAAASGAGLYRSTQAVLAAMSDALFYVELPVKDAKVARPLGLRDCAAAPCLDALESRYALRSKDHVRRNLDGFDKLFFGCGTVENAGGEPRGFDDLLRAAGVGDIAERVRAQFAAARSALARIDGDDFRDTLINDPAPVAAVYEELRRLVEIMKTEFVGAIAVALPAFVQGDTD